jgi:hypothetical protein
MVDNPRIPSSLNEAALRRAVEAFLQSDLYYSCLLLVHTDITRLETATNWWLHGRYNWPVISVGKTLGDALIHVAPPGRGREAEKVFHATVRQHRPGPLLCTEIDLLFEPSLSLDPFRLLRRASRQVALIVTWPGVFENDVLAYAVPEHGHYRTWPHPDLCDGCIVSL